MISSVFYLSYYRNLGVGGGILQISLKEKQNEASEQLKHVSMATVVNISNVNFCGPK